MPLGLLPVFALVALASEGQFERPSGQPVASQPVVITSTGLVATAPKPGTTAAVQATTGETGPAETTNPAGPAAATGTQSTTGAQTGASGIQNTGTTQSGGTGTQPTTGTQGGGASTQTTTGSQGGAPTTSTGQTAVSVAATSNAAAGPAQGPGSSGSTIQASGPFIASSVKPGDTVAFVAQLYGVSPASVAQASGLPNADRIRVGQVLTIPNQPGYLYRMQPGETLDQISARTGVRSDVIASASMLSSATAKSGDVILIPDMAWTAGK
jgi:LysM repeat protein